jgi:putative endonuclease
VNRKQVVGKRGEELAGEYLKKHGYILLEKNARTPYGEIDLVATLLEAEQTSTLVFVEVKTRTSRTFGYPEEAMTRRKKDHLMDAVAYYMQKHTEIELDWRIDVIAVSIHTDSQRVGIRHFINAVSAETEGF